MAAGDLLTAVGQIQYGNLLIGRGTPYSYKRLSGWAELPALDSGTVLRSGAHGAYPGLLLAQSRTIGLDGLMVRAPRASIGAAVDVLEAGLVPVVDELPLAFWADERGPRLVWARCLRYMLPMEKGYRVGTILGGAVQWEATDARRYGLTERTVTASLPMPEPGLNWGTDPGPESLDWPLSFGAVGSAGGMSATNAGNAETHPVVEFRGPVLRPSLTNLQTGDVLEYDLPLAAGDVLVVDTRAGTVTLNGTASRLYTVTARSVPEQTFTLAPGTTDLLFRAAPESSDPAASALVRYRPAYW
ncbi:phage distal tail protein [Streptomyces sp. NBC_01217]|uniref:phage distal tail protein n=1 Tax=Streptomyces sp. NBC_01217 TaxID=2903779 RepID=UPI002E11A411|nr:phage tail family protein [Streptomyces sp. NBC_01217]